MELATPFLWLNVFLFTAGFYMLVKGSDVFVDSAAALARCIKVSELVIGLTVVSIGTSLPELASSLYAAFCNEPDFIVGNIAGSCTCNIICMLGVGIVMAGSLVCPKKLLTRDVLLMNLIYFVTAGMVFLGRVLYPGGKTYGPGISRWCGIVLFAGALAYCCYLFKSGNDEEEAGSSGKEKKHGILFLSGMTVLSLVMIVLGSKLLVDNVVWGARSLGISTIVISATIVAFGTSVPELAVTIAGVKKGHSEIVLGNIIGSNIFNILLIFGLCAIIRPLAFIGLPGIIHLSTMIFAGLLLYLFMFTGKKLTRAEGIVFLFCYAAYLVYNARVLFL